MRSTSFPFLIVALAIGAAACGKSSSGGPSAGGGGAGQGGLGPSGGTLGSGGPASGGGTQHTGGAIATGGVIAGGGTSGNGGSQSSAGGATTAAGGALATGGVRPSGGAVSVGGTTGPGAGGATGGTTLAGTGGGAGRASGGSSGRNDAGPDSAAGGNPTGGSTGSSGYDGGPVTTTIPGNGCTPPLAYANLFATLSGHTQQETNDKLTKAWGSLFNPGGSGTIYNNGPGSDEAYVEDYYNGDVRTEGMSYGMMIAVQLNHQTEFDKLWTFAKKHMVKQTGTTISEITWSVSTGGGGNGKTGGAPDGDEYFAAALVFAHTRWGDTSGKYNYATEAKAVLDLVRTKDFNASAHLVLFSAGANFVDGSYVLPAFYQTWACFDTDNADFWNASVIAARNFFHKAADSSGVIPDHSGLDGTAQGGAGSDAIRCVVNIMMDWNFYAADSWESDTYAAKYGAHEKNIGAGAQGFCDATLGFGLPASSGKAFVDKIWSASVPSHDYWNGVLYMLALLHVSGAFQLYY